MVLTAVVTGLMRDAVPVGIRPFAIDDGLFVRGAKAISEGSWLGPFDGLTLSKGPAYPAFVALADHLGLQLKVAEQLLHLSAVLAVTLVVRVATRRPVLSTGVFVVLGFSAASFASVISPVIREGFYASVTLLLVALLFLTVLLAARGAHPVLVGLGAVAAGPAAATFLLTREESTWLAPTVPAVVVVGLLLLPRRGDRRRTVTRLVTTAVALAVVAGVAVVPSRYVAGLNERHYGRALVLDSTSGELARAYLTWSGVRAGPQRAFVPVPASARRAVYAISPAARELEPGIEGDRVRIAASCSNVGVCDDFSGGFFPWTLRFAAERAGHFGSATESQAFFGRLADDITAACTDGRLTCDIASGLATDLLGDTDAARVWRSTVKGLDYVLLDDELVRPRSAGDAGAFHPTAGLRRDYHAVVADTALTELEENRRAAAFTARDGGYRALASGYHLALPVLLGTAFLGLLLAAVRRRPGNLALALFGLVLLGAALSRLVLLAVVDSASFQSADRTYQMTTYTLTLTAAVVGTALLVHLLSAARPDGE